MRLAGGIVIEKDQTFGTLKFSALRREVRIQNEGSTCHSLSRQKGGEKHETIFFSRNHRKSV